MNHIYFRKFSEELDELVSFMTGNSWEFHSNPYPTEEQIRKAYNNGYYHNEKGTFWIEHEDKKSV